MNQHYKGEINVFISVLFLTVMAIVAKKVPQHINGVTIAFFRFAMGIPLTVLFILIRRETWQPKDRLDLFLRGLFGSVAMVFYFTSINVGSSGRATLLNRTAPFFVALWSVLFFKKKVKWWQLVIIVVCFGGVSLVFYDNSPYPLWGDIAGMLSAIFLGLGIIYVKRSRVNNSPAMTYLILCAIGLAVTAPFVSWKHLDLTGAWLPLLGVGGSAWFAQLFFAGGMKYISALEGAIITYLLIPLTLAASIFINEETVTTRFIIGILVILSGLVLNTILENRRKSGVG